MNGVSHVEISRANDDWLPVELTVGALQNNISASLGQEPEDAQILVLVRTQPNPQLLNVQLLALRRAEQLIQDQIRGLVAAIEGQGT